MEIGRRELLTGIAAITVAGVVPALPNTDLQTPTRFLRSFIGAQRAGYRRTISLVSHWHYDQSVDGDIMVRHLETGLTFIRPSSEANDVVLDAPFDDNDAFAEFLADHFEATVIPLPDAFAKAYPYGLAFSLIHRVAAFIALSASMVLMCRPQHQGAIFFHYRPDADPDDPYHDPITVDAPPLPSFG